MNWCTGAVVHWCSCAVVLVHQCTDDAVGVALQLVVFAVIVFFFCFSW